MVSKGQCVESIRRFNCKDRLVDQNGHQVSSDYKGRQYQIIAKSERAFYAFEKFGRGFLGVVAVVLSLGIALLLKPVRDLFTQKKAKIRFGVLVPKEDETFPLDEVRKACQQWMKTFHKDFEPSKVKKYKFEQLYLKDVVSLQEETEAMRGVYKTSWNEKGTTWVGNLPDGWVQHSGSNRSRNIEHPKYPGYIFKFCSGTPGRGVPAAHFLRVPQGKELQRIVSEEGLDELEIVDECLIALKSQDEIQKENESEQNYYFVVKSKKLNLLDKKETILKLSLLPRQKQIRIAQQIMRMICKSGLGDVGFHNFNINKETGKLAVLDTEPLFGSLLLDVGSKSAKQYQRNNELMEFCTNLCNVTTGLDTMIEDCKELPIFEQVAKVYKECL